MKMMIVFLLIAVVSASASAAVPPMINYQGKLMQPSGAPVPDGTYQMQFAIYDVPTGGTALWSETNPSVQVKGGLFAVLLGSVNNLPSNVFDSPNRFFGVTIAGDPEMTPRQQIASVAFAQRSGIAGTVDDGAATTAKIADGAVTSDKLAQQSVSTTKLRDGSVTAEKLATGAIVGESVNSVWQSWMPTFSGSDGSAGSFAFAVGHAKFLRVGKLVLLELAGRILNTGGWAGCVRISLPVTPAVPVGDCTLSGFIAPEGSNPAVSSRGIPIIPDVHDYIAFLSSAGMTTLSWSAVRERDYVSVQGFYEAN